MIRIKAILIFGLIIFICFGCNEKKPIITAALGDGLEHYRAVRNVNQSMLKGYGIEKIAFFKNDSLNYKFVYKLTKNTISDTIEKYGLGMVFFTEREFMGNDRDYLWHIMQPSLQKINGHSYIIEDIALPTTKMDSLRIFLTDRDKYTGVYGHVVLLKNIEFK